MIPAVEALERLVEGNRRFVAGARRIDSFSDQARLPGLVAGQEPIAAILGCSDARVPVEILFDQGLGDLFVIRVAGNIVGPSQIGSVEFAVEQLGTRLVVVLGHTHCGAVKASLAAATTPARPIPGHLGSILERILPAVRPVLQESPGLDREALERQAVRANIHFATHAMRQGSEALIDRLENGEILVIGAEYALETGEVDFFKRTPG